MPDDYIHYFSFSRRSRAKSSYYVSGKQLKYIVIEKTGQQIEGINEYDDGTIQIIRTRKDLAPYIQELRTEVFIKSPDVFPLLVTFYDHWDRKHIKFRLVYQDGQVKQENL